MTTTGHEKRRNWFVLVLVDILEEKLPPARKIIEDARDGKKYECCSHPRTSTVDSFSDYCQELVLSKMGFLEAGDPLKWEVRCSFHTPLRRVGV